MNRLALFLIFSLSIGLSLGVTACTKKSKEGDMKVSAAQSGLQIEEMAEGNGATAEAGKTLSVNYTGWLTDGNQFDSSVGRAPFQFTLGKGEVIPGWEQGVMGMKVGGKRKLTVPPEMAYGERGAGGVIPPNATLIFEVELLEVK